MSTLPLFYRTIVPLDRDAHRGLHLAQPQRFTFARKSHFVPAVVEEFAAACRHLPIVFLPDSAGPVPAFFVGAAPGRCALIDEAGTWTGRYVPAYLRRYPFIAGEDEGIDPMVCFDVESGGILSEAPGTGSLPLFAGEGAETPLLQERIRLVADYAESARRTVALGRRLQDLGLMQRLTIRLQDLQTGATHTHHGALGVDEPALGNLPDADLVSLRKEGWLGPIYTHLISLQTVADFLTPVAQSPVSH